MSSPMTRPALHDTLTLLDGSKRWVLPGVARVVVSLTANTDSQDTPGEGNSVTQLNEATAEVSVTLTMWTEEQWTAYQSVLARLRRGTKDGGALFTSTHPEIRARRMKRLYFVSEQPEAYSPKMGYVTKLSFKEKLKDKSKAKAVAEDGPLIVPGVVTPPATGSLTAGPASSAAGKAVQDAALAGVVGTPSPADGGRATTATPGYCSASVRVAGTKGGMDPKLYGASALQTEGNYRRAGLSQTFGPGTPCSGATIRAATATWAWWWAGIRTACP